MSSINFYTEENPGNTDQLQNENDQSHLPYAYYDFTGYATEGGHPFSNMPPQQPLGEHQAWPTQSDGLFWDMRMTFTLPSAQPANGTTECLYTRFPDPQYHIVQPYSDILYSSSIPMSHQTYGDDDGIFAEFVDIDGASSQEMPTSLVCESNLGVVDPELCDKTNAITLRDAANLQKTPPSKVAADSSLHRIQHSGAQRGHAGVAANRPHTQLLSDQMQIKTALGLSEPSKLNQEYVEDIVDADHARDILAHPDPEYCQRLDIDDDDFEYIKASQQHFFARQFFEALTTSGISNPTGHILEDKAKLKFDYQQKLNLEKVHKFLQTPSQQKQARANCILAFDAGVFISDVGIPSELYEALQRKSSKSHRLTHVDITSKCSKRLQNMIRMVRNYKLVAVDVMMGKNLHRFAYDPLYYAEQKVGYLVSNVIRQDTAEIVQKARQELGLSSGGKRKKLAGGSDAESKRARR